MMTRERLIAIFSSPSRQAAGWTMLGIVGVLLAVAGAWLVLRDGDDAPRLVSMEPTAIPTPTRAVLSSPSPSATPSPTPTATETPVAVSNTTPRSATVSAGQPATEATPEPTAEPTPEPVVAGGPYCPSGSGTATPTRVLGTVSIGGSAAPDGTTVTLAFDGVAGPAEAVTISGATAGFSIDFNAAQGECANRVGAAIGAYVNGTFISSGQSVGGAAGQGGFIRFDIALP